MTCRNKGTGGCPRSKLCLLARDKPYYEPFPEKEAAKRLSPETARQLMMTPLFIAAAQSNNPYSNPIFMRN